MVFHWWNLGETSTNQQFFVVPAVCVFGGLDVHLWYFITSLACEHIKLHASNQYFVWHFFRCKSQQNIYSKLTQISQPATQTIFFPWKIHFIYTFMAKVSCIQPCVFTGISFPKFLGCLSYMYIR